MYNKFTKRILPLSAVDVILDETDSNPNNLIVSLSHLGTHSAYMSNNLGSVFLILMLITIAILFTFFFEICRMIPWCFRFNTKLKKKLRWNFALRLIIEGVLSMQFSIYLNLKYGKHDMKILG